MRITRIFASGLCAAFLFLTGCGKMDIANRDNPGRNIICFGDSITEGWGAGVDEDYPSLLRKRVSRPVINAGRSGDTTGEALQRLEEDVLSADPYLVIVELGANDYLKQAPRQQTFKNLDEIVSRIQERGAMVVLAEVRVGLLRDEYYEGLRAIAENRRALFIPDIMRGITWNADLKSDGIHPNAKGYALIAGKI
ncbi:MAG TPA: GDSL-type esterase/lipase family protein, partial [Candidatus Omnitrophota bacterium]|nr:GDSL-type esterase/lipase family protein [Candidatus Omnitrophota bacterium]